MILRLGFRVVYGLVDPREGVVKYVGVTDSPQRRFMEHIKPAKRKSIRQPRVQTWIKELEAQKLLPIFIFLDSVRSEDSINTEREWIRHFETIAPLLNERHKK